ncbi:MAG: hypothetical protein ACK50M_15950 [Cyclobacteriaceae bacterium]|jgi:ABC-2 type transport system permease protein
MTFWLRGVDLFRGWFRRAGVDYEQMRSILETKLLMDNRRQSTVFARNSSEENNYAFLLTLSAFFLLGAFGGLLVGFLPAFWGFTIYFGMALAMMALTLIADFSSILLDTSDNTILVPRPISSRTLWFARVLHILLYIVQISLALLVVPLIVALFRFGPLVAAGLVIAHVLTTILAVSLTHVLYQLIMRFTTEERMKNFINYFQILMAILLMGSYQLLPRLIDFENLEANTPALQVWHVFVPPFWMAGLVDAFLAEPITRFHLIMAALAVVVPAALWWATHQLSRVFVSKLADLGNPTVASTTSNKGGETRGLFFSPWLTAKGIERGAYEFTFRMLLRDRKLKLKIYPSIGYMFVVGFILTYRAIDFGNWQEDILQSRIYLVPIYLTFTILQTAFLEIRFTDEFKSAWVFASAPLRDPGPILMGAWKAVLIRFFVPYYLIISLALPLALGPAAIPDLLFGLITNLFMFAAVAAIYDKHLPFSQPPSVRQQGGHAAYGILMIFILALVGVGHYFLGKSPPVLLAAGLLLFGVTWWLLKRYAATPWSAMQD